MELNPYREVRVNGRAVGYFTFIILSLCLATKTRKTVSARDYKHGSAVLKISSIRPVGQSNLSMTPDPMDCATISGVDDRST